MLKKVSHDTNYMNKRKTFLINMICIYNSTMICTYLIILKDAYGGCYVKYIVVITEG